MKSIPQTIIAIVFCSAVTFSACSKHVALFEQQEKVISSTSDELSRLLPKSNVLRDSINKDNISLNSIHLERSTPDGLEKVSILAGPAEVEGTTTVFQMMYTDTQNNGSYWLVKKSSNGKGISVRNSQELVIPQPSLAEWNSFVDVYGLGSTNQASEKIALFKLQPRFLHNIDSKKSSAVKLDQMIGSIEKNLAANASEWKIKKLIIDGNEITTGPKTLAGQFRSTKENTLSAPDP